jgi:hypothetical protein
MTATIHRLPIVHRQIPIAPEDERDPHTTAVRMFKKAFQYARKNCGTMWTINLIRGLLAIEDTNGWRQRAAVWEKD